MKRAKRNLDDDDDGNLGDGDVVRVPAFLMDAMRQEIGGTFDATPYRPGFRAVVDEVLLDRRADAYLS